MSPCIGKRVNGGVDMCVSYTYYQHYFFGTRIQNEADFRAAVVAATAYVDSLIMNRENLQYPQIRNRYNNAVCAVADVIYAQDNSDFKTAESVGNHSVSFSVRTDTDFEAEKRRKALTFLAKTGLLYGGMQ